MPTLVDAVIAPGHVSRTEQPLLRADSIVLRPWVLDDAPDLVAAYQEPDIQRWHARSMTLQEARWIADAHSAWAAEQGASWAVDLDGRSAGRMTLKFHLAHATPGWGTGRATRIAAEALPHRLYSLRPSGH
ncbi:MAG: GNAT family N-acetyltransferase [Microlunatus sp.]|nr:GNAT family N-acetyltransferase [Microlunatus sp.]MDN5769741.1 GNAT family N-acetyltransferase [Microlunatus sp.]